MEDLIKFNYGDSVDIEYMRVIIGDDLIYI